MLTGVYSTNFYINEVDTFPRRTLIEMLFSHSGTLKGNLVEKIVFWAF